MLRQGVKPSCAPRRPQLPPAGAPWSTPQRVLARLFARCDSQEGPRKGGIPTPRAAHLSPPREFRARNALTTIIENGKELASPPATCQSSRDVAPLFNVSVSYIYKILARRRTTGETSARPQRHGPLPKLAPYSDLLRDRVVAVPDTTIDELRLWLLSEHKIKVGNTCVWKQLNRLGLTLKKDSTRLCNLIPRSLWSGSRAARWCSPCLQWL
jgi:transposase